MILQDLHISETGLCNFRASSRPLKQNFQSSKNSLTGRLSHSKESAFYYRFSFNGKETDDEVSGSGNQYDYGFRIYNPRIAKFLSVDPLYDSFPELSSYQFASNTPIQAIDLDGEEMKIVTFYVEIQGDKKTTIVKTDVEIKKDVYVYIEGVPHAVTYVYLTYATSPQNKYLVEEMSFCEKTKENNEGLVPSATYDYRGTIPKKGKEDRAYIYQDGPPGSLKRKGDVIQRDLLAPENNTRVELIELLDIKTRKQ
jgi:RHS repeat-associated protein